MTDLSYQMMKCAHEARETEEQKTAARKKNLLILVMHYLSEEGYVESALSLARETNLDFRKYEVCDNVDLETVLLEYESYYYVKFHKYPRITKKLPDETKSKGQIARVKGASARSKRGSTLPNINLRHHSFNDYSSLSAMNQNMNNENNAIRKVYKSKQELCISEEVQNSNGLVIEGKQDVLNSTPSISGRSVRNGSVNSHPQLNGSTLNATSNLNYNLSLGSSRTVSNVEGANDRHTGPKQIIDFRAMLNQETRLPSEKSCPDTDSQERLLKPLGGYAGYTGEWRELALTISREIFLQNPNIRWDDIIGLNSAKRLVKEAVVYPIKYPQLFAGILSPWKGLLLYGPPGTGKTLLAKAVATECNTTFFNISASTIVSKWRGDSEKLVRVLFELARFHAPSTIFLDELDSLMSQRGSITGCSASSGGGVSSGLGAGMGSEHEGSRRMKTELLMQMDGLAKSDDLVFLLAASNLPWELDHAMLRRLEKRILVDLPNKEARKRMFETFLPPVIGTKASGGLHLKCDVDYDQVAEMTDGYSGSDIRLVCKEAAMRVVRKIFDVLEGRNPDTHPETHVRLDPVTTADVQAAISSTMPSARQLADRYVEWQKQFGSS